MKASIKTGFSFGLTSGIITTLGLIVGLNSSTHSQITVIGGILTIAIADAFSDALGIHVSQESHNHNTKKSIWESTISTFISKFIFALTFIVPIIFLELNTAIIVSVVWGFSLLSILSYITAKQRNDKPLRAVLEHLFIGLLVIIITNLLGRLVSTIFK